MTGIVDRYTPSEPFPRLVVALLATAVPFTAFLWGAVYVVNMYETTEAIQSTWGVVLLGLFLGVLLSTQAAHVLVRDVATRARSAEEPADHASGTPGRTGAVGDASDPVETIRRRYAAGELTDDELDRRIERLLETDDARESLGGTRTQRLTE